MWCKIVLPFPFSFSVSLSSISTSLSSRAHFSLALFVIFVWPGLLHSFSLTESFNFIYVKVAHGIWSFPEIFVFASGYVSTFRTCVQVYLEWLPWLMLIFTFISHFVIDFLSIWSYNLSPLSLQGSVLYTKMLQITWRFLLHIEVRRLTSLAYSMPRRSRVFEDVLLRRNYSRARQLVTR